MNTSALPTRHGRDNLYPIWGVGTLWTWGFLHFFLSQAKFASTSSFWADVIYIGSTLLASLLIAFFGKELASPENTRRLAISGCALTVIGAMASMIHSVIVGGSVAALFWGKSFSGLGLGLFWVAWGKHLATYELERVESIVLGWLPVLIVLFVLSAGLFLASSLSIPVVTAVVTMLPIASLAILLHLTRRHPPDAAASAKSEDMGGTLAHQPRSAAPSCNGKDRTIRIPSRRALIRPIIVHCLTFSAIILCWNCVLSFTGLQPAPAMLVFAVGTLIAFAAMAFSFATTTGMKASTLYRWSLPAATIGIAILQLFEGGNDGVLAFAGCTFLAAANIGYEGMTRLFALYVAKFSPYGPVRMVAVGFAIPSIGSLAGYVLWEISSFLGNGVIGGTHLALSIALVTIAVASSLTLGRDQSIRSIVEAGTDASGAVGPERSLLQETPDQHRPPLETIRASTSYATSQLGDRCSVLSRTYGLTPKEAEVLVLLAQGHSRTYIREALFISKGTVDAHVHHIYRKMGINSRDELIRMAASDANATRRSDRGQDRAI